jgi:aminoglycoside/choline kinase family phosphotransferase
LPERLQNIVINGRRPVKIAPMQGDASTRMYFRAFFESGDTCVLMAQPHPGRNEEESFLITRAFFEDRGLPVPALYFHDRDRSVIAIEDLGDTLLERISIEGDERTVRARYTEAVELLIRLKRAGDCPAAGVPAFDLAFDMTKLMWEMDFFLTHFVRGLCGTADADAEIAALRGGLEKMCAIIARQPRILVHRDYHSRNLLVHKGSLWMIDFQDARMGPAQYDLCSLLRDSYVDTPEELCRELIEMYAKEALAKNVSLGAFVETYDIVSLQRNIKALGTFGFQVGVRGAERYRSAIARTGRKIEENPAVHLFGVQFVSLARRFITDPASTWNQEEG